MVISACAALLGGNLSRGQPLSRLLIHPASLRALPVHYLLRLEPQSNLLLSTLYRVRTMTDVSANVLYSQSALHLQRSPTHVLTIAKSPRIVPGAEARGLVAPNRAHTVSAHPPSIPSIAQLTPSSLHSISPLPNHSSDRSAKHIYPSSLAPSPKKQYIKEANAHM